MTSVLQAVVLTLVMLAGIAVALSYDPLRQVIVNGIFGLLLVVAFVALQAPDVAISELVVTAVPFPAIILVAIYRTRSGSQK